MADDELEQIRQKRMAELQQQYGGVSLQQKCYIINSITVRF